MQRWSRRALLLGSASSFLAACSYGRSGDLAFNIGVSGEGNHVRIYQDSSTSGTVYIATIASARGLGTASIVWWGFRSPHQLRFQIYLTGLEQFILTWANATTKSSVYVGVSSVDQSVNQIVRHQEGAEIPIQADSPYWMDVMLPTTDRPSYMLRAPAAFVAAAPTLWAIRWIDFYR